MSSGPAQTITALMEGYYVVRILDAFHSAGLLDHLSAGATVDALSAKFGYERDRLAALLDYLSLRSDVVKKTALGYHVATEDPETQFALHLLDQYVGAYGPCLEALSDILGGRVDGGALVDRARHAAAFARADRSQADLDTLRLLSELRINNLVDLGCSTAGLMIEYALRNPEARCIGIDCSEPAIEEAQRRIARSGLSGQVRAVEGDLSEVDGLLSVEERDAVECVIATNVANAYFSDPDGTEIDAWFATLKTAFPRRIMLLGDYFGSLGHPLDDASARARGLFHDVAQLLSGQGIPPGSLVKWTEVLERNGCTIIRSFEGEGGDMRRFILLYQL
ncbi:Methyltransferase domain-containing protein [Paracoccus aminovorans]|uniref:Methyltransferase domain-containing protein n=2 Tax=Paracoccus aminovorans TaxID=34004 RepID=A0A1I3F7U4_9RHOB|nr:methyltransferase [Paracoccus aminovorans]SFI06871.1 Methyltransferase domain-containing protein [Paracoccus aminovorans]